MAQLQPEYTKRLQKLYNERLNSLFLWKNDNETEYKIQVAFDLNYTLSDGRYQNMLQHSLHPDDGDTEEQVDSFREKEPEDNSENNPEDNNENNPDKNSENNPDDKPLAFRGMYVPSNKLGKKKKSSKKPRKKKKRKKPKIKHPKKSPDDSFEGNKPGNNIP